MEEEKTGQESDEVFLMGEGYGGEFETLPEGEQMEELDEPIPMGEHEEGSDEKLQAVHEGTATDFVYTEEKIERLTHYEESEIEILKEESYVEDQAKIHFPDVTSTTSTSQDVIHEVQVMINN